MDDYCPHCYSENCGGQCVSLKRKYYEDLEDERNYYNTMGEHDIECDYTYCNYPPEYWTPVDDY